MKVLITRGTHFRFSDAALEELKNLGQTGINKSKGKWFVAVFHPDDWRTNKRAISVVEKLGAAASGKQSMLKVIEVPDGVDYYIDNNNGVETIHEYHRVWY
jgi:hypothetical protein